MLDEDLQRPEVKAVATTPGFMAMGVFLFFGACMAGFAALTLLWRGTVLDEAWKLNPKAYAQLAPWGGAAGVLFLLLSLALAMAGIGWFRRRVWGWRLAVGILSIQVAGDAVNLLRGDLLPGGVGVAIAGAVLVFLLKSRTRRMFG